MSGRTPRMFSTIRNMLFDRTEGWPTGRFDAIGIWRRIIDENQTDFTRACPPPSWNRCRYSWPKCRAAISRRQLGLYPYAQEVLDGLRKRYPLAVITDAQCAYPWANCTGSACSATSTRSSFPATMAIASPTGGCFSLLSMG